MWGRVWGRAQPQQPGRDMRLEGAPQHPGVSEHATGGSLLSLSLQAGGNGKVTGRMGKREGKGRERKGRAVSAAGR